MSLIRVVEIENFRAVKGLRWLPGPGVNCLIGPGDSYAQGKAIIGRIRVILAEAGATLDDVCYASIYYSSRDDAEGFNRAWVEEFGDHRPARAAIVTQLVVDAAVEVQAFAVRPKAD